MEKLLGTKLVSEGPSIFKETPWYHRRRLRLLRIARARYLRRLRETPLWRWPAIYWQYRRALRDELSRITPSPRSLWGAR